MSDSVWPHRRQPTRVTPVLGILQAGKLEWVAISFSNACKWKVKVKSLSCVLLLVNPWTAAHQAPPSMGFSRQEYQSGLHCLLQYNDYICVKNFFKPLCQVTSVNWSFANNTLLFKVIEEGLPWWSNGWDLLVREIAPTCHRVRMLQLKILHATTKAWWSWTNKYIGNNLKK